MLAHAIEAGMFETETKPVDNFELTLPEPQSGLAKELHKSSLNFGFVSLDESYAENALRRQLVSNLLPACLHAGRKDEMKMKIDKCYL